jgi:hypothetical protein
VTEQDALRRYNSICLGWLQTDLGGPEGRAQAPMTAGEGARIVVRDVRHLEGTRRPAAM